MKAAVFNGKVLADKIKLSTQRKMKKLKLKPLIVSIRVGKLPASAAYVARQEKNCLATGIKYRKITFSGNVSEKTVLKKINTLNNDPEVTGIIVLLPLPDQIDSLTVHKNIAPEKDIEGVNPDNTGLLARDKAIMPPCTAAAVMKILKSIKCSARGKHAVIVGCSNIVGKPLAMMLLSKLATVTVCNLRTKNLSSHTQSADILIAAAGVKNLIKPSMIKKSAVVIDV
ncbi:MAG: bifunctional 5,10-methylenetetrahydrofolate dehydrogenase/5,10-methenyltetrahydrofolate cyclohydrolase, partial [Elusimicrobiota bacterium]|nr:bifunctional 5,10-methylenetetrahydrofolate dehydrogenase/5,10-methenyltetrahydrofolate cyclohydrolase [Elusimicrobiota bacterium]